MVNSKIQAAEKNLIHVYNRFPIALDHGEGMYLYDTEGKKYLDFAAGFAVCGLGYDNKELNDALKAQIDKLYHTSNLYYHESCGEAAAALNRISGIGSSLPTAAARQMKAPSRRRGDTLTQRRAEDMSSSRWSTPFTAEASGQYP